MSILHGIAVIDERFAAQSCSSNTPEVGAGVIFSSGITLAFGEYESALK